MKVNLLTLIRKGGPYSWDNDLAYMLNKNGVLAKHVHRLPMLPESCVYRQDGIFELKVESLFQKNYTHQMLFQYN